MGTPVYWSACYYILPFTSVFVIFGIIFIFFYFSLKVA